MTKKVAVAKTRLTIFLVFMLSMPSLVSLSFGLNSCEGDSPRDAPKEKFGISTASPQQSGSSSSGTIVTYSTDVDPWMKFEVNEGWDLDKYLFLESSPIDFYIDVDDWKPDPTISPKPTLTLRVYDVDVQGTPECGPEVDVVYINGHALGALTGANNQWSICTFDVEPSFIVEGDNHVQVFIDTTGSECWAVEVDFGELKVPFNIKVVKIEVTDDIDIKKGTTDVLITGPIWEKKFDAGGKLIDVPGVSGDTKRDYPIADWFKSNKFNVKITLDAWPKKPPKLNPFIDVYGCTEAGSTLHHLFGWEGEYEVTKLPQKVLETYFKQEFAFLAEPIFGSAHIADRQFTDHILYLTLEEPRADVKPPKEIWLKKSIDWANGAANEVEVASKLNNGIYAKSGWNYEDNSTGWKALVEGTTGTGNCVSFSEVWMNLGKVLGIGIGINPTVERYRGSSYNGFVTKPSTALDGKTGNAHDGINRWVFGMHQVGLLGGVAFYDPTFGKEYSAINEFVEWNFDGTSGSDANGFFWNADGHKVYEINANPPWGEYKYKSEGNITFSSPLSGAQFTDIFTDYGVDTDSDGKFDKMTIEIGVNVTITGSYSIFAHLFFNTTFITARDNVYSQRHSSSSSYLTSDPGIQIVSMSFSGEDIFEKGLNGDYSVFAILLDVNGNLIDNKMFNTSYYSYNQFREFPAEIVSKSDAGRDSDDDSLFDLLVANVTIDVSIVMNCTIYGALLSNSYTISSAMNSAHLTPGQQIIELNFDGRAIRKSEINGPYILDLTLLDKDGRQIDDKMFSTSAYSYISFEKPSAEFTGTFYDYGVDIDSDGLFDFLSLNVGISVSIAGNYTLLGYLFDYSERSITVAGNSTYLGTGISNMVLNFDGTMIYRNGVNGPYTLRFLQLFDANRSLIDGMDKIYNTTAYSYTIFQKPKAFFTGIYSDCGVDTDMPADGLFNFLTIQAELNVTKPGNYTLEGALYDANGSLIVSTTTESFFGIGSQLFALDFDGVAIYSHGFNGSYNLGLLRLYDESVSIIDVRYNVYNTTAYNYTNFQRPSILLTEMFSDYGMDPDADGFYNYLVVEIGVMAAYDGTYEVNARLKDVNGNEIVWASNSTYLCKDVPQTIQLRFCGKRIFGKGVNGPYYVKDLSIYYSTFSLYVSDVYTTSTYNYTEFQKSGIILGTVTDEQAIPVPNALVYVSGVDYDHTNTNGSYKLIILQTGTYTVEVVPPPELNLLGNSTTIDVTIGETTILNFVLGSIATIATIDIDPDTLNLKSKGKWITAYIELPEGCDVADINVATILLNDTIPAELHPIEVGDYDKDTIPDLMVKFNRTEVISYIIESLGFEPINFTEVTLTVTGQLHDGTPFMGSDVIRVVMPTVLGSG